MRLRWVSARARSRDTYLSRKAKSVASLHHVLFSGPVSKGARISSGRIQAILCKLAISTGSTGILIACRGMPSMVFLGHLTNKLLREDGVVTIFTLRSVHRH
jgi:hypothetical protein